MKNIKHNLNKCKMKKQMKLRTDTKIKVEHSKYLKFFDSNMVKNKSKKKSDEKPKVTKFNF